MAGVGLTVPVLTVVVSGEGLVLLLVVGGTVEANCVNNMLEGNVKHL